MRRFRLLFFVLLFLALTALRLGIPEWPRQLRDELWAAIGQTRDYEAMTETMGRNCSEQGFYEGLIAAIGREAGQALPADESESDSVPAASEDEAEAILGETGSDAPA